jgi:hypothetical protein
MKSATIMEHQFNMIDEFLMKYSITRDNVNSYIVTNKDKPEKKTILSIAIENVGMPFLFTLLRVLVELGADVNLCALQGEVMISPLSSAIKTTKSKVLIQYLIEAGANPERIGSTGPIDYLNANKYYSLEEREDIRQMLQYNRKRHISQENLALISHP